MKSRDELVKGSKSIFDQHKTADALLATADGNYFLPEKRNAASMHARDNSLKLHEIKRTEVFGTPKQEKTAKAVPPSEPKSEPATDESKTSNTLTDEELAMELLKRILNKGVKLGIVSKKSNWYKYGEVTLGNGETNALEALSKDADLVGKLTEDINKAEEAE